MKQHSNTENYCNAFPKGIYLISTSEAFITERLHPLLNSWKEQWRKI